MSPEKQRALTKLMLTGTPIIVAVNNLEDLKELDTALLDKFVVMDLTESPKEQS